MKINDKEERVVIRIDDNGNEWTMDKKSYDSIPQMTPDSPQWKHYQLLKELYVTGKTIRMPFGTRVSSSKI